MKFQFDSKQKCVVSLVVFASMLQMVGCSTAPHVSQNAPVQSINDDWDAYDLLVSRSLAAAGELIEALRPAIVVVAKKWGTQEAARGLNLIAQKLGREIAVDEIATLTADEVAQVGLALKADAAFSKALMDHMGEKEFNQSFKEADELLSKYDPAINPETKVMTPKGVKAIDTRLANSVKKIVGGNITQQEIDPVVAKKITGMMKRIHASTDTTRLAKNAKGEMVVYHEGLLPVSSDTCSQVGKTLDPEGVNGLSIIEEAIDNGIVGLKNGAHLMSNAEMKTCAIKNAPYFMTIGIKKIGVKNPKAINRRIENLVIHCKITDGPFGAAALSWATTYPDSEAPAFACNKKL